MRSQSFSIFVGFWPTGGDSADRTVQAPPRLFLPLQSVDRSSGVCERRARGLTLKRCWMGAQRGDSPATARQCENTEEPELSPSPHLKAAEERGD
ncbi:hypothetical protein Q5P01_021082 [Channa striata]|uniref:Uncharacterized protein n=1 Tax=Channa striata TaxID=64152 RepID=A0AA88LTL5_CHASR|nr:hypothetical protein Q5P01_021082 [Channa striata]